MTQTDRQKDGRTDDIRASRAPFGANNMVTDDGDSYMRGKQETELAILVQTYHLSLIPLHTDTAHTVYDQCTLI